MNVFSKSLFLKSLILTCFLVSAATFNTSVLAEEVLSLTAVNIRTDKPETNACAALLLSPGAVERTKKAAASAGGAVVSTGADLVQNQVDGIAVDAMIAAMIPIFPPIAILLAIRKGMSVWAAYNLVKRNLREMGEEISSHGAQFDIFRLSADVEKTIDVLIANGQGAEHKDLLERMSIFETELNRANAETGTTVDRKTQVFESETKGLLRTKTIEIPDQDRHDYIIELLTDVEADTTVGFNSLVVILTDGHGDVYKRAIEMNSPDRAVQMDQAAYFKALGEEINKSLLKDGLISEAQQKLLAGFVKAGNITGDLSEAALGTMKNSFTGAVDASKAAAGTAVSAVAGAAGKGGKFVGGLLGRGKPKNAPKDEGASEEADDGEETPEDTEE